MPTTEHKNMQHLVQHELCLRELDFLHEEISVLERYLADVYYHNASEEALAKIDHFENQFILQKDWLNKMKHEIETADEDNNEDWGFNENTGLIPDYAVLQTQMEANRVVNKALKDSFLKFLVKWM